MCDTQQTTRELVANLLIRIWSFDEILSPAAQTRRVNTNEAGG